MTMASSTFTSDLFASDDPTFEGVQRLLTRAGAEITNVDLVTASDASGGLDFDRLAELSLVLGLEPRMERQTLRELMLHSPLFVFEDVDRSLKLFMPGSDRMLACVDVEGAEPPAYPASGTRGRALVFSDARGAARDAPATGAVGAILGWTGKPLLAITGITFVSNVLGLCLPLFTLAVYDQVLAAGEPRMLATLTLGLGLGLLADGILRAMRSKMVSRSAAHLDVRLSSRVFGNMMRRLDGADLIRGNDVSGRLREIDRIRGFLFGPIGIALIDAPFVLIYVVILVLLLGWSAIVPIGFLAIGFAIVVAMLGSASRRGRAALSRAEEYGTLCAEIASRIGFIQAEGSSQDYEARFRDASARLAEAELLKQRTAQIVQLSSGVLVSLTVLLTLVVGALTAMGGTISVGTLIAAIALVWRMSAPLPALLQAWLRWPDVRGALASASELLRPGPGSAIREGSGVGGQTMSGKVAFSSVTFTYGRGQTAALRNLSCEIGAGEIVAITGACGAGKSTLLDLASGLLEPQFGSVTIDGVNPQQVAPSTLRQSIGYLPRENAAVPLSIRDFLRLGVDPIDRFEVDELCDRMALSEQIEALPHGDLTPMSDLLDGSGLASGIALARVLASNASLLLLDEPDAASRTARATLLEELKRRRGERTVMIVTHEPSFIAIADRVLILNNGMLSRICAPADIVRQKQA